MYDCAHNCRSEDAACFVIAIQPDLYNISFFDSSCFHYFLDEIGVCVCVCMYIRGIDGKMVR